MSAPKWLASARIFEVRGQRRPPGRTRLKGPAHDRSCIALADANASASLSDWGACYGSGRSCASVVRACRPYARISPSVIAEVLTSACLTIRA